MRKAEWATLKNLIDTHGYFIQVIEYDSYLHVTLVDDGIDLYTDVPTGSADHTDILNNYVNVTNKPPVVSRTILTDRITDVGVVPATKRLLVDALNSNPAGTGNPLIPADTVICFTRYLSETGGSVEVNVDGSTTPVEFTAGPGAGETWYLSRMSLMIKDNGTNDPEDFGAISGGLSSGLKMYFTVNSTEHEFYTFKQNKMLAIHFTEGHHFIGSSKGFLNTANAFIGSHPFCETITLNGDNGDLFGVSVQDDLTGVNILNVSATFWKVIT